MIELNKKDIDGAYYLAGNIATYVHEEDNEDEDLSLEELSVQKPCPQIGRWGYSDIDMLSWRDFL